VSRALSGALGGHAPSVAPPSSCGMSR
jgi:hypothetical protein